MPARGGAGSGGQSLVELALVLPILFLLLGGIIQYGVIFAAKHTLIQVARDTARWAATQTYAPCTDAALATPPEPVSTADQIASTSGLISYTPGMWDGGNFVSHGTNPLPAVPPHAEGVEATWSAGSCPPLTTDDPPAYIRVRLTHRVPLFVPGLWLLPGGTCDGSGCSLSISETAQFRMEPPPP